MTIAICLKVADGLVFGADSAATVHTRVGRKNVYRNAEKVFNLRKEMPVAAVSYGLGGLRGRSVSSLAKDLRARFTDPDDTWHLDPNGYRIEDVAQHVREFFVDDLYTKDFNEAKSQFERLQKEGKIDEDKDFSYAWLGFLVGGFSHDAVRPEVWKVEVDKNGNCDDPSQVFDKEEAGKVIWRGQHDPLRRLIYGHSADIIERLESLGVEEDNALDLLTSVAPVVNQAMPIQDAIDLVDYLATVAAGYARFAPGLPAVSPPFDIGTITLHERFRWVERKHYFPADLNLDPGRYDAEYKAPGVGGEEE